MLIWYGWLLVKVGNALCCEFNQDSTLLAVGYHENAVAVFNVQSSTLEYLDTSVHKAGVR